MSLDKPAFAGVPRILAALPTSRFEPFGRLADEILVGLMLKACLRHDDFLHGLRSDIFGSRQEPMPLAEGGVERDAAAFGRFPQAHTIDERLSVGKRCIAAMELSQRCTG